MAKRYKWGWASLMLLISASVLPGSQEPLKVAESPVDAAQQIPTDSFLNNLGGMDLVDQYGRPFHSADLISHVVLFNFIFTSCGSVCPMQTRILAQVFQGLPENVRGRVRFVSLSIDPGNDTPEKLRIFSKAMDAERAGWSFLTGNARQIEELAQRLRIYDESESGAANKPEIHRTTLWLVDGQGRMLQRYRGDPPDKERLIRELVQVSQMTIH